MKEISKELEDQFQFLGENTEKYITFAVSIKNDEIITYRLLTALGLRQHHYQILLIIFLKYLTIINSQILSLILTTY